MPEQTPDENPSPERFDPEQDRENPEHFLTPILGELTVHQAEVMLKLYGPSGQMKLSRYALAKYFGVSPNAIRDVEQRVWQRFPDMQPEPTPVDAYMRPARGPREKPPRDRQERYTLGEIEVLLDAAEFQVMSLRYDPEGRRAAQQKDVAGQTGISLRTLIRIEHRVLNDFPELAELIQKAKAAETAKRKKPRRSKPKKQEEAEPTLANPPEEESPLLEPDLDRYATETNLQNLYDVSKPPDDQK